MLPKSIEAEYLRDHSEGAEGDQLADDQVEAVLAREILTGGHCFYSGNSFQYRLKWKGWGFADCTWEPESNAIALGAGQLISDFNDKYPIYIESGLCCSHGTVRLPALLPPPPLLAALLTQSTSVATRFRDKIRQFNSALAMASMSCRHWEFRPGGPPAMRIGGEIKHFVGSLEPSDGAAPQFLSTYVYDPQLEKQLQARYVPCNSTQTPQLRLFAGWLKSRITCSLKV